MCSPLLFILKIDTKKGEINFQESLLAQKPFLDFFKKDKTILTNFIFLEILASHKNWKGWDRCKVSNVIRLSEKIVVSLKQPSRVEENQTSNISNGAEPTCCFRMECCEQCWWSEIKLKTTSTRLYWANDVEIDLRQRVEQ